MSIEELKELRREVKISIATANQEISRIDQQLAQERMAQLLQLPGFIDLIAPEHRHVGVHCNDTATVIYDLNDDDEEADGCLRCMLMQLQRDGCSQLPEWTVTFDICGYTCEVDHGD